MSVTLRKSSVPLFCILVRSLRKKKLAVLHSTHSSPIKRTRKSPAVLSPTTRGDTVSKRQGGTCVTYPQNGAFTSGIAAGDGNAGGLGGGCDDSVDHDGLVMGRAGGRRGAGGQGSSSHVDDGELNQARNSLHASDALISAQDGLNHTPECGLNRAEGGLNQPRPQGPRIHHGPGVGEEESGSEDDEAELVLSLTSKSDERGAFSLDDLRELFHCGGGGRAGSTLGGGSLL